MNRDKAPDVRLKRTLGLWQLTVSGVGIVIGAGIYVLIGAAAEKAGNLLWASLALAALMSALTGLSYAELGSMFPTAAAEYEFVRQAFSNLLAFLAGWLMLIGLIVAATAVALGFAEYFNYFVAIDKRLAAAGLVLALTAVVLIGIQRSIWLTTFFVVLQVGGLVMVIIAGLPHVGSRDLFSGSVSGVLGGSALMFFAFIGFDEVITLSEETADPGRTTPRALLLALGISALLYVLVGIAAVSVVGSQALGSSDHGLTLVIEHDWGSRGSGIVAVIAIAATVNTTLLVLTAASRLTYGLAQRGALPPVLSKVSNRGVPYTAALLALVGSAIFILPGELDFAAAATDLAIYLVFIAVNLAVIVLRFSQPETSRGFAVPGRIGRLPLLPILALICVLSLMVFLDIMAWLIVTICLGAGLLVYLHKTLVIDRDVRSRERVNSPR